MQQFYVTDDVLASHGQRIGNYFIDFVFMMIFMFIVFFCIGFLAILVGNDGFLHWMQHMGKLQEYLISALLIILYYGISETASARTLGKLITGTVVVMEDGSRPDSNTILKRTFCRFIPFDPLSFLGATAHGWHDSIPDVYVVDKKKLDYMMAEHRRQTQTNNVTDVL